VFALRSNQYLIQDRTHSVCKKERHQTFPIEVLSRAQVGVRDGFRLLQTQEHPLVGPMWSLACLPSTTSFLEIVAKSTAVRTGVSSKTPVKSTVICCGSERSCLVRASHRCKKVDGSDRLSS